MHQLAVASRAPAALEERPPARPRRHRGPPGLLGRDGLQQPAGERALRCRHQPVRHEEEPGLVGRSDRRPGPVARDGEPLHPGRARHLEQPRVAHARVDPVGRGVVGQPEHVAEAHALGFRGGHPLLGALRRNATRIIALLRLADGNVRFTPVPDTPPRPYATAKATSPRPRANRRAAPDRRAAGEGEPGRGRQRRVDARTRVHLPLRRRESAHLTQPGDHRRRPRAAALRRLAAVAPGDHERERAGHERDWEGGGESTARHDQDTVLWPLAGTELRRDRDRCRPRRRGRGRAAGGRWAVGRGRRAGADRWGVLLLRVHALQGPPAPGRAAGGGAARAGRRRGRDRRAGRRGRRWPAATR